MSDTTTIDQLEEWYQGAMALVLIDLARRSGVLGGWCLVGCLAG